MHGFELIYFGDSGEWQVSTATSNDQWPDCVKETVSFKRWNMKLNPSRHISPAAVDNDTPDFAIDYYTVWSRYNTINITRHLMNNDNGKYRK